MAVSLAFGIGFATVLVLIFIPALLSLHESVHRRIQGLKLDTPVAVWQDRAGPFVHAGIRGNDRPA
jgi:predicted RND superfamily exporter protein